MSEHCSNVNALIFIYNRTVAVPCPNIYIRSKIVQVLQYLKVMNKLLKMNNVVHRRETFGHVYTRLWLWLWSYRKTEKISVVIKCKPEDVRATNDDEHGTDDV